MNRKIVFNRPYYSSEVIRAIRQAFRNSKVCGDGEFTKRCSAWMEEHLRINRVLLTPSGTAALELGALLLGIKPGDEVIMPSFTFTSTANCVLLWGAKPVFVEIEDQSLNLDLSDLGRRLTDRAKTILPVHYGGCSCDMDALMKLARKNGLTVLEDAAQAIFAGYRGRSLGGIGDLGAFSFHETKNFSCGEGGALLINRPDYIERAEIIREKGTDRSRYFRGQVDKYTWQDIGSSYLLSDLLAAYLYVQLQQHDRILAKRRSIYEFYQNQLAPLAERGYFRLPIIPSYNSPNHHVFYLILPDQEDRNRLMDYLKSNGILAIFHYIPLHLSRMGRQLGYHPGDFPVSESISARLLRLPLYSDLRKKDLLYIVSKIKRFYHQKQDRIQP